jgi:hypothetical protein
MSLPRIAPWTMGSGIRDTIVACNNGSGRPWT